MKTYVHARLSAPERATLEDLKQSTGRSESEIVRRGIRLLAESQRRPKSALAAAGPSVGRFTTGPRDLSTDKKRLEGFGE